MPSNEILHSFRKIGIIPVVVLNKTEDALPLGEALCEGGLPTAEITFRTDAAEDSIRRMVHTFPDMLIGAGTVLNTEQVDRAIDAGAKFIVSPGLNLTVVKYCKEKNITVIPGIQTPTEIEMALTENIDTVKFFPAEMSGGLNMMKALAGPYTNISFIPTGGINASNVREYLKWDRIVACGGSWMVNQKMLNTGNFEAIKSAAREASQIVKEVRGF